MRKITGIYVLLFAMFFVLAVPAQAHVLVTDGSIGAVMHIDPDDDPIAGQQSNFLFVFKDKQNKFSPTNCNCTFVVREGGTVIFTQPLFQNTANQSLNVNVLYTFPKRDVYEVSVVGKPNTVGAFQPFTLSYDIRVDKAVDESAPREQSALQLWITSHIPQLVGGVLIMGLVVWVLWKKRIKT